MSQMQNYFDVFEFGEHRYQPDPGYESGYKIDQRFLAVLVGAVAFGLPLVMMIAAIIGPCFYISISHFYFSPFFGAIFVIMLSIIGTFLLAYRGANRRETRLASFAGFFAFGIALFPTTGRGCTAVPISETFSHRVFIDPSVFAQTAEGLRIPEAKLDLLFQLFAYSGALHYTSAAIVFIFLAYYCFRIFTRVIPDRHRLSDGSLKPVKARRNLLYKICGWIIVVCIVLMGLKGFLGWTWWNDLHGTFICETLALWAFGFSWMVKGRFFDRALLDDDEIAALRAPSG